MAFFSDGNSEYFSLNLNPIVNEQAFVYELTNEQILVSRRLIRYLLLLSLSIFATILLISSVEYLGLTRNYISDLNQEMLVLVLAGLATAAAFMEIGFFAWIKKNRLASLNGSRQKKIRSVSILKNKSWMAYFIFLLDMLVPFISLTALPGGLSEFFNDTSKYGSGFRFLFSQLIVLLIVFLVLLLKRVATLLRM